LQGSIFFFSLSLSLFFSLFKKTYFFLIYSWVASEVCLGGNLKVRVRILRHIIAIARHCASMNNYNTVFEIVSGLALPPVSRLTKSWDSLPAKYSKCNPIS